jgi:hypothetical protein
MSKLQNKLKKQCNEILTFCAFILKFGNIYCVSLNPFVMTYNFKIFKRVFRFIFIANLITFTMWAYVKINHISFPFYNILGISCITLLIIFIILSVIGLLKFLFIE